MRKLKLALTLFAVSAFAVLAGCASAPPADVMKAEAANFQLPKSPEADKAMVYVVRPSSMGTLVRFNVFLNDQQDVSEMGYTRGSQYIYFSVPPGEHRIYSKAENWADIAISLKAGEIVFLQQSAEIGAIMARNSLSRLEDYQGKYYVKTLTPGTLLKTEK